MDWYKPQVKTADHGDTLRGQMMAQELARLVKKVASLRAVAASGGPQGALSRWRGEIRRRILLLPSTEVMPRMSMSELEKVASYIEEIESLTKRYRASRLSEIMGTGNGD